MLRIRTLNLTHNQEGISPLHKFIEMADFETILEKAKKIQALAEGGYLGEAETAKRKLEEYIKKYGLSWEDLSNERVQDYDFQVVGNLETRIFSQIIYQIFGKNKPRQGYYKGLKHIKWISLTKRQYVEVSELFEFHKKNVKIEFEKMRNRFLSAYATDHDLFPEDHENQGKIDFDELLLINNLRNGLNPEAKFRKSLKEQN